MEAEILAGHRSMHIVTSCQPFSGGIRVTCRAITVFLLSFTFVVAPLLGQEWDEPTGQQRTIQEQQAQITTLLARLDALESQHRAESTGTDQ